MVEDRPEFQPDWRDLGADAVGGAAAAGFARHLMAGLLPSPASHAASLCAVLIGAMAATLAGMALRRVRSGARIAWTVLILAGAIATLWGTSSAVTSPLSWGEAVYVIALSSAVWTFARLATFVARPDRWVEFLRLQAVGAFAVAAVEPYITSLFVGRVDARWYAYSFRDFVDQWRSGIFPVFVGQGEFAFPGSVHPFRSAPFHLYLGGVIDWLTGGHLDALSLQHATVVVCALLGTYGMYFGLTSLVPQARWRAAAVAMLYILCPGVLAPLYCTDMYMTFMTIAAVPLVVIGNARAWRNENFEYVTLAVGLAFVWYCHPPTALRCTLLSAAIQMGRLVSEKAILARARPMLIGISLFAGLTVYYFWSMAEIPAREPLPLGQDLVALGAMMVIGTGSFAWLREQRWSWLLSVAGGLAVLWLTTSPWFLWGAGTCTLILLFGAVAGEFSRSWRWQIVAGAFLLSALAIELAIPHVLAAGSPDAVQELIANREKINMALRPLRVGMHYRWPEYQLGWALLIGMAAVIASGLIRRRSDVRWLVLPIVALGLLLYPIPLLGDFWVAYFPISTAFVMKIGQPQRELHILAAFVAVGSFLIVANLSRRATQVLMWILGAAIIWSAWQYRVLYFRGKASTFPPEVAAHLFLPENLLVYPFMYDLAPLPGSFIGGHIDWRMETRLLDENGHVIVGPREAAAAMDSPNARSVTFQLAAKVHDTRAVPLQPAVRIAPHARLLVAFDHWTALRHGQMLQEGPRLFNEDIPGFPTRALFDEFTPKEGVITLMNSGDEPEDVHLTYLSMQDYSGEQNSAFATARLIPFTALEAPIRLESFIPYRVHVRAPRAGILETPRIFIPGYRCWIDGQPSSIIASQQRLVAVHMPAGEHDIEIKYVGDTGLWVTLFLTISAWTGLIGFGGFRLARFRNPKPPPHDAASADTYDVIVPKCSQA